MLCLWVLGQTWHAEHVASDGHNHLATAVENDVADADGETFWGAVAGGIG